MYDLEMNDHNTESLNFVSESEIQLRNSLGDLYCSYISYRGRSIGLSFSCSVKENPPE